MTNNSIPWLGLFIIGIIICCIMSLFLCLNHEVLKYINNQKMLKGSHTSWVEYLSSHLPSIFGNTILSSAIQLRLALIDGICCLKLYRLRWLALRYCWNYMLVIMTSITFGKNDKWGLIILIINRMDVFFW